MYNNYEQFFGDVQKSVTAHIPADHVIGTPFDFLYEADQFYDTPYHLRYESRAQYTEHLCRMLTAM